MNILTPSESHCKMVRLPHPVLKNTQLDLLCNIRNKGFHTVKLPMLFEWKRAKAGLQQGPCRTLVQGRSRALVRAVNYIILIRPRRRLHACRHSRCWAVSDVHHHPDFRAEARADRAHRREREIREVMHAGVAAGLMVRVHQSVHCICAVLDDLVKRGEIQLNYETAEKNYIKALCKACSRS
jgi:glutamate synthase (NADPH/NADH) large chain